MSKCLWCNNELTTGDMQGICSSCDYKRRNASGFELRIKTLESENVSLKTELERHKHGIRRLAEFNVDERKVCEVCQIYKGGIGCPFRFAGAEECLQQLIDYALKEKEQEAGDAV